MAYSETMRTHVPGEGDFSDELYAISALQVHLGTIDTLIFRKIEKLKASEDPEVK